MALVFTERYGPARVTGALAVIAIVVGWALAQDPYLLPPSLTLDEAAAADVTLEATVIVVGLGALILGPSLWFLYRLVLTGRLRPAMSRLVAFAVACFVLGLVLMVVLDILWLGVPLMFVFIVAGVFAIADPRFLKDE